MDNEDFPTKAYTLKQLAKIYGVSPYAIRKSIALIKDKIGDPIGHWYFPKQVQAFKDHYGTPSRSVFAFFLTMSNSYSKYLDRIKTRVAENLSSIGDVFSTLRTAVQSPNYAAIIGILLTIIVSMPFFAYIFVRQLIDLSLRKNKALGYSYLVLASSFLGIAVGCGGMIYGAYAITKFVLLNS